MKLLKSFHVFALLFYFLEFFITFSNAIECEKSYTVASGDFCYKIWTENQLSQQQFFELNPSLNCDALQLGQSVCLSQKSFSSNPKNDEISCLQYHNIISGDTCYQIQHKYTVTMPELLHFNENFNCSNLQIGQKICVKREKFEIKCIKYANATNNFCNTMKEKIGIDNTQFKENNFGIDCSKINEGDLICVEGTITLSTTPQSFFSTTPSSTFKCGETYKVQNGDTCYQISKNFMMEFNDFMPLNPGINCDTLQIDQSVCVSVSKACFYRYSVTNMDKCESMQKAFKLTVSELNAMNPKLDCGKLEVGQQVCVIPASERQVPSMKCIKRHTIQASDNCYSMQQQFGITLDETKFLNPWLDCNVLKDGAELCSLSESSVQCAVFHQLSNVEMLQTCEQLFAGFDISYDSFMNLNPTFQCEKLKVTSQICIGQGYFSPANCLENVRINPDASSCQQIATASKISVEQLQSLNPTLNCSTSLIQGYHVCVRSFGNQTVDLARNTVVEALSNFSSNIKTDFQNFRTSPTQENNRVIYQSIVDTISNVDETSFQQLYNSNADFKKMVDADTRQSGTRQQLCEQLRTSKFSAAVKTCVCNSTTVLYYCQVKMIKEAEGLVQNYRRLRKKRADDSNTGPKIGCAPSYPKNTKNGSIITGCFGGGCSFPIGWVSLDVSANLCVPPVSVVGDVIKLCTEDGKKCEKYDGGLIFMLKELEKRSVSAGVSLCIGKPAKELLEPFGISACLKIVSVDYKWFVGQMSISTGFDIAVINFKVGGTIKTHKMVYEKMCEMSDFECETYCLWKHYGDPDGASFGFASLNLLPIFGWDGWPLIDEQFGEPQKAGCKPGTYASVLVYNKRTCDKNVWIRCWSGDDKMEWKILEKDSFGFQFKPVGNTLFVCEWVLDSTRQKIGFDVYGGKSDYTGKKNFYFAVKNDGVYFGTEKEKQDELKEKWDKPCEGNEDEDNNDNGDDTDVNSAEPPGESSVPAAACGKRVVGYYTGWSKREVDEEQLKKLTHVVFAFVAMNSDGSIAFDKVSEDSEADAGNIAKKRFMDLKTKARKVNAGVYILFALGGWDNSQYFSLIARDSSLRATFINNIIQFLKDEKIDGVDLDWEYPVTGGATEGIAADKENFVALLKELRSALENLQKETNRNKPYLISYASAAGDWTMRPAYDLESIVKYVDFINIMTYDYYGAWGSKWGKYTGPPAPLFYGSPKGFSGKLNADFTSKYYSCNTKKPSKINMGVPFYGRFWKNVGADIGGDEMWREAEELGGKYEGGYVPWRDIGQTWNLGSAKIHDKVKSPYIWNSGSREFLGFENEESLKYKVDYAIEKNLGGLMIWAIDQDDDANTLLNLVSSADLCSGGSGDTINYKCVPINDIRWWIPENGGESKQGMCGKSAPLINGYYPVCDPDDPGYSCCGAAGYCGSEDEFCACETCIDYRANPDKIIQEPIKPSRSTQWYLMDAPDGQRGRCGPTAPPLNGKPAICNPDDDSKYCCSNGGYCGIGDEFCKCDGCVNFRENPNHQW